MKKYPVVALCGGARYGEELEKLRWELTKNGHIVITAGPFREPGEDELWAGMEADARRAARLMQGDICRRQIDMADSVYVVNPDGEISGSVWSELCYARMTGKPVEATVPLDERLLDEKVRRHIAMAKELAEEQNARRIEGEDNPGDFVYFTYDGTAVFDPWLNVRDQMEQGPGRGVDPFQYYGAQKAAAFIERILTVRGKGEVTE